MILFNLMTYIIKLNGELEVKFQIKFQKKDKNLGHKLLWIKELKV